MIFVQSRFYFLKPSGDAKNVKIYLVQTKEVVPT